jgi:hypothetical protein
VKRKLACGGLGVAGLVAFAIVVGFGCGTMENLGGRGASLIGLIDQARPRPFGGVARDVKWIISGNVFFIADIPFSLAGDVLTLPKVLRKTADPLQEAICNGEKLESQPGQWKMNPSEVLKNIPLDSPILEAEAILTRHDFDCSYGSTANDDKPGTKKGLYLQATSFKRTSFQSKKRITVTIYYEDDKVSEVEVLVRDEGS